MLGGNMAGKRECWLRRLLTNWSSACDSYVLVGMSPDFAVRLQACLQAYVHPSSISRKQCRGVVYEKPLEGTRAGNSLKLQ